MKKILALILALCMCIAVLVACNDKDTAQTETETKKETTTDTEAESKPVADDDGDDDEDEGDEGDEGDGSTPVEAEYTIGSVAEWEALAAAGDPDKEDFLNKTVKLTANIDFGTATATTLFKTFAGTFDGGNFIVKGTSVSRFSLIANTLDGATVKNLTVDGFTIDPMVDGVESASVIAAKAVTTATEAKNVTFENVAVLNCSIAADKVDGGNKGIGFVLGEAANVNVDANNITVNACAVAGADNTDRKIGGVVGIMTSTGLSTFEGIKVNMNVTARGHLGGVIGRSLGTGNLHIEKVKVTGTLDTAIACGGSEGVGGIIGSKYNEAKAVGDSYVKNAYINAKLFCSSGSGRAGGIAGNWYKNQNSEANLTVENCYVSGEFTVKQGGTMKNRAGGLFGEYGSHNSTLTLKNVILEAAIGQTWPGSATADPAVTPDVTKVGMSRDDVSDSWLINYASTAETVEGVSAVTHTITATNCYTTLLTRSNGDAIQLIEGFSTVATDKTAAMISYDTNGYISAISAPAAS